VGGRALSLSDLSEEELRQKFRENVAVAQPPERADALIKQLDDLERASSLQKLTDLLL